MPVPPTGSNSFNQMHPLITGVPLTNSGGNSKTETNRPDNSMKCDRIPQAQKAHPLSSSQYSTNPLRPSRQLNINFFGLWPRYANGRI
ncbi:MAG: hypothetical protein F6J98_04415 [Moorea sp. SIO4G2]|nr:hypothetical protein [Moorena sp. SIO4G2]